MHVPDAEPQHVKIPNLGQLMTQSLALSEIFQDFKLDSEAIPELLNQVLASQEMRQLILLLNKILIKYLPLKPLKLQKIECLN